jgi:hypothetical protein
LDLLKALPCQLEVSGWRRSGSFLEGVKHMDGAAMDHCVNDPVRPGSIPQPKLVNSAPHAWHRTRKRHRERQPDVKPGQGIGQVTPNLLWQPFDLSAQAFRTLITS